jgi:hypothetical protein
MTWCSLSYGHCCFRRVVLLMYYHRITALHCVHLSSHLDLLRSADTLIVPFHSRPLITQPLRSRAADSCSSWLGSSRVTEPSAGAGGFDGPGSAFASTLADSDSVLRSWSCFFFISCRKTSVWLVFGCREEWCGADDGKEGGWRTGTVYAPRTKGW